MADTKKTLNKPNAALVMVPRVGRLTPVSRKLYNVLLQRTQQQIAELRTVGEVLDARHFFSAPLNEMMSVVSVGESDSKTAAKQYLREMRRTEVDWEAPDASTGVIWRSMGLLSEVDMEIRAGIVWVLWALPPTLLIAVADPERYTPLDLEQMAKLQNYTAIALYEIASRYKNNPTGVTSRNSPEWWVDALTSAPPSIDVVTGKPNRREWRKLKNASIVKAIEEINVKTDLTIELIEIKEGRAVKDIQFSIQKKRQESVTSKITMSPELAEMAARVDLDLSEVVKLLAAGRSEGEIKVGLIRVQGREQQKDLEPILNKPAYLRKIIEEGGKYIAQEVTAKPSAPAAALEPPITRKDQRRSEIKIELLALEKTEQLRYVDIALESLKKSGLDSPTIIRKYKAGDWNTGVLLQKTIEVYALDRYGAAWGDTP